MEKPNIGIIGRGNIGSEIYKRVLRKWNIGCIIDYDGVYNSENKKIDNIKNYKNHIKGLDLLFLSIPTYDEGETELGYISSSLEYHIPIVTSAKGAPSNYFSELENVMKRGWIGYSATVCGGTRVLRFLEERGSSQLNEIHAVLNGTLNYIFDNVSRGRGFGESVEEAKKLGYTEPGAKDYLEVINKEAVKDVPMKASILFNICNLTKERIRAKDIAVTKIRNSQLERLIEEAANRRYIVSIAKEDNEKDVIWGFKHKIGGWHISAGFRDMSNPFFKKLILSSVDNAVLISEGESGIYGNYILSGPGAGSKPTVNSMIRDAEKILGL